MPPRGPPPEPTPEILALKAERQRKREAAAAAKAQQPTATGLIPNREWIDIQHVEPETRPALRFQTWNMLAQTLVRRELFPTSDCLKAHNREPMTLAELTAHRADILCLQEVDRLDKLLPPLLASGYAHTYGAGPRKLHGCMILHRDELLEKLDERVVQYDQLSVGTQQDGTTPRTGIGRVTKNIALMVALRDRRNPVRGCLVATTHLFWHPAYTYERVRQVALLTREVRQFRTDVGHDDWPCFVIGDFNFQPIDAGYALLVGAPWTPEQEQAVDKSRVVHVSVDVTVGESDPSAAPTDDDDEGGGETDPDRIIVNCRAPREADGLLTASELRALAPPTPLRSAYDDALRAVDGLELFGARVDGMVGAHEPRFTSYTHYWKATLDYLFVLEGGAGAPPRVVRVLKPLPAEAMEPGLPKLGVCASDHMSLAADIAF